MASALSLLVENAASAGVHFLAVPARNKPEGDHKFQVGERVSLTLHTGRIVDGPCEQS